MTQEEEIVLAGKLVLEYRDTKRDLESLRTQAKSLADDLETIKEVLLGNRAGNRSTENGFVFYVSKRNGGTETGTRLHYPDAEKVSETVELLNQTKARLEDLQARKKSLDLD